MAGRRHNSRPLFVLVLFLEQSLSGILLRSIKPIYDDYSSLKITPEHLNLFFKNLAQLRAMDVLMVTAIPWTTTIKRICASGRKIPGNSLTRLQSHSHNPSSFETNSFCTLLLILPPHTLYIHRYFLISRGQEKCKGNNQRQISGITPTVTYSLAVWPL